MLDFATDQEFDWDPEKNSSNVIKHGFGFRASSQAFKDSRRVVIESNRAHADEARHLLIGSTGTEIVAIVFTIRGDSIRIVSARKASRRERVQYRQGTISS